MSFYRLGLAILAQLPSQLAGYFTTAVTDRQKVQNSHCSLLQYKCVWNFCCSFQYRLALILDRAYEGSHLNDSTSAHLDRRTLIRASCKGIIPTSATTQCNFGTGCFPTGACFLLTHSVARWRSWWVGVRVVSGLVGGWAVLSLVDVGDGYIEESFYKGSSPFTPSLFWVHTCIAGITYSEVE